MTNKPDLQLPNILDQLETGRRKQLLNTIKMMGLLVLVLIAQRVYFVGINNIHLTAWATLIAIFALHQAVKNDFASTITSTIVLVFFLIQIAMLAYRTAGLSGPGIMLAPIIPLLATLLVSRLAGWLCAICCVLIILLMSYLNTSGYAFPSYTIEEPRLTMLRGLVLIGLVVLITYSGWYYSRLSDAMKKVIWQHTSQDYLTGIANRRAIDHALETEFKRASRNGNCLSLLMIDIDLFKRYNDYNGHQQGDKCLQTVVNALQACLKRPQDVLGRWGGDEFVLVMPDTDAEGALHVAGLLNKHIQSLGIHYQPDSADTLTVSIGVASCMGNDQENCESLFKKADDALYKGKHNGRNQIVSAELKTAAAY